jgi:hypothetical protein
VARKRLAAMVLIGLAALVGAACAWAAIGPSTTSNIGYVRAGKVIVSAEENRDTAKGTATPQPTTEPTPEPSPTATATATARPDVGSDLTADQQLLLEHIPSEIRESCATPSDPPDDFAKATASLACSITDKVFVEYYQFISKGALHRVWERRRPVDPSGDRCTDLDWEGTWYADDPGTPAGRLQCWGDEDFAAIEWTHDDLLIYAEAYIFSHNVRVLSRAWAKAGPVS